MSGPKVDVVWDDEVVGKVIVSDNRKPEGREEEHELFGSSAVDNVLPRLRELYPEMPDQPIFLMAVRAVATAIRGGSRDEQLEQRISHFYLRHNGITAWMRDSNPMKRGWPL